MKMRPGIIQPGPVGAPIAQLAFNTYSQGQTSDGSIGAFEWSLQQSLTVNAACTFLLVATCITPNTNDWNDFPAPAEQRVDFGGSQFTFIDEAHPTFNNQSTPYIAFWYLRNPTLSPATLRYYIDCDGDIGSTSGSEPDDWIVAVWQLSGVITFGTPYEGLDKDTTDSAGSLTSVSTPTTATFSVCGTCWDESAATLSYTSPAGATEDGDLAGPSGSIEAHFGHRDLAGAKTWTSTLSSGTQDGCQIAFHLLKNA